jgi:hypothetical protein
MPWRTTLANVMAGLCPFAAAPVGQATSGSAGLALRQVG